MAQNFNLTQTGEEVQGLLNQVTPNTQDIADLKEGEQQRPTTEQVAQIVAEALRPYSTTTQMNQAIAQAVSGALADYSTTAEMNAAISSAINSALADYSTTAQMNTAITQAITSALASYYTKHEIDLKVTKLDGDINAEKTRAQGVEGNLQTAINNEAATRQQAISAEAARAAGVEGALQAAIDIINGKIPAQATTSNQLADKDFVNSSISTATADFKGTYNSLQELEQVTANANDYAFVIATDAAGNTIYKRYKWIDGTGWVWEYDLNNSSFTAAQWAAIQSGITAALVAKLSDLPTNAELNQRISTAITTALGRYYTKTEIDAALQSINTAIGQKANQSDLTDEVNRAKQAEQTNANNINTVDGLVAFINKSFGKYDGETVKTLQQAKAGKYVNVNGGETSASGYGISAPITLNAGDILLVPSAQAVPAAVSVIARLVDRTYQKVIVYTYTYQQANPELYATATADYDPSLVYTAIYDTTGETPVLTGWALGGTVYQTLPATHEVSEQFYEPLMKQAVAAMPSTGYYIYLCPTPMTIVVSGYTATVSGGEALVVGWGIFKNITTNFVGAPGQSVLAQAFAVLFAAIDGLKAQLDNLGETKAVSIDFEEQPKLCGQPLVIEGDGAPAAPVVPTMVGQRYHDNTNRKVYEAFVVTNSVSDWVLIN